MFLLCPKLLPWYGDQTPSSVPPPAKGRSNHTNSVLYSLLPLSQQVLYGSIPVVRYSYLLSVHVLQALLCLKVYSWWIRGEKCIPHPSTPPPSCSFSHIILNYHFLSFSDIYLRVELLVYMIVIFLIFWQTFLLFSTVKIYFLTEGEGDNREQDGWMASLTQWIWVWASSEGGEGQGSLVCCSPWGRKELNMTEQLNNNSQ